MIDNNNQAALNNFIVLIVFFVGCFIAEFINHHVKEKPGTFQKVALILQALFLIPTICIQINASPNDSIDLVADCFLALFGAMQLCAFQNENGNFYVSTMMTIVLKMVTTHLSLTIKEKEKDHLLTCLEYLAILASFILGIVTFYLIYRFAYSTTLIQYLPIAILGLILIVLLPMSFVIYKPVEQPKKD